MKVNSTRKKLRASGRTLNFLLRDEFSEIKSAPLTSPRICRPGPGNLTIEDTGNKLALTGGEIVYSGHTGVDDPNIASGALTRAAGLMFACNLSGGADFSVNGVGFDSSQSGYVSSAGMRSSGGDVDANDTVVIADVIANPTPPSKWIVILRSAGMFAIIDSTLAWVGKNDSTSTVYARISNRANATDMKYSWLRVAQLGSPWDTDYGIATQRLAGARSPGETFTHEADCLIEFEMTTLPSAGQAKVNFRIQDSSNYWQIKIEPAGDLKLIEVVATTGFNRGLDAAVLSGGERIVVKCFDEEIKVYYDSTLSITYSTAPNFKTQTNGELDTEGTNGSISDIVSWPRTLSGKAKDEIDKYTKD